MDDSPCRLHVQVELESTLLLPGAAGQAFGSQQLLLTADQRKLNNKHYITTDQSLLLSSLIFFLFPAAVVAQLGIALLSWNSMLLLSSTAALLHPTLSHMQAWSF